MKLLLNENFQFGPNFPRTSPSPLAHTMCVEPSYPRDLVHMKSATSHRSRLSVRNSCLSRPLQRRIKGNLRAVPKRLKGPRSNSLELVFTASLIVRICATRACQPEPRRPSLIAFHKRSWSDGRKRFYRAFRPFISRSFPPLPGPALESPCTSCSSFANRRHVQLCQMIHTDAETDATVKTSRATRRCQMAIKKTMKAAVVEKFGQPLVVKEVPVPTPGPGQALIEIFATGVCHTDLHAADGDWPINPTPPFIPGHEGAGVVVALGPGVTHLKEGDRVGTAWLFSACGHCDYCLSGWETLCPEQQNSGYSVNGSFAEYAVGQADYLGRLPKSVSFVDVAPILCAGVTTYKGLKMTEAQPGEWVVISGIGGLGHIAIQYAKAMGLHVAAVDLDPEKMALARQLGAEIMIDAKTQDPPTEIQKQIGGAHGVLVTAVSPIAFKQAVGMLRRGGTCVLNGRPPGGFSVSTFDPG